MEAVTNQLDVILVSKDIQDMPEELQERITHLHKMLTKEGSYRETIPAMEYVQIVCVVEEIFSLFHDVSVAFAK